MTFLTVGHSNRTLEHFIAILEAHGVRRIVDVRSIPRSRRHPHFDTEALSRSLGLRGIAYEHRPGLGGRRRPMPESKNTGLRDEGFRGFADYMQTAEFETALAALVAERSEPGVALMCAEADASHCHRGLIADALVARAHSVVHLESMTEARPHALSRAACVDSLGHVTYPGPRSLL